MQSDYFKCIFQCSGEILIATEIFTSWLLSNIKKGLRSVEKDSLRWHQDEKVRLFYPLKQNPLVDTSSYVRDEKLEEKTLRSSQLSKPCSIAIKLIIKENNKTLSEWEQPLKAKIIYYLKNAEA